MKFDLEKSILEWKNKLFGYRGFEPENIEEIEDHLRNYIDDEVERGVSMKEAFVKATKRYSNLHELSNAFIESRTHKRSYLPSLPGYVISAVRVFKKNLSLTMINLVGLSIGIASFLFISAFVFQELSFDEFHENKDRIYRVSHKFYKQGRLDYHGAATFPRVGPSLKQEFPIVENQCRLFKKYRPGSVQYEDQVFREENLYYADSTFFKVFSYPLVSGNANNILNQPNTAIVDQQSAIKYFGDDNPVGKRIRVGSMDGEEEFEIVGVFKSVENSHLQFSFIFSYSSYVNLHGSEANIGWGWYDFYTYILLAESADVEDLEHQLPGFIDKHGGERLGSEHVGMKLQPLTDIYLESDLIYEAGLNGDNRLVNLLIGIAIFILAIAWLNYINLYSARTITRAKEIGVRQVMGAGKIDLVLQFLTESFLINGAAVLLGLLIFFTTISQFNEITYLEIDHGLLKNGLIISSLVIVWVLGSLISGLYPALVLSKIKVIPALRGILGGSSERKWLQHSFVVFQFVLSTALMAATYIIHKQVTFIQDEGIKIDTEKLLVVRAPDVITDPSNHSNRLRSFRERLLAHSAISNASVASEIPGKPIDWWGGVRRVGDSFDQRTTLYRVGIDQHYFSLYGNQFLAGRNYSLQSDSTSVILNEIACLKLGFESPEMAINKFILTAGDSLRIIGVVRNFHQEILKEKFKPTLYLYDVEMEMKYITLTMNSIDKEAISTFIETTFYDIFPNSPYEHFFVSDFLNSQFKSQQAVFRVFSIFSIIAIFIASLGLVGLASFYAMRKTKEICIRKILGSTIFSIYARLSNEMLKLVLIGNVIAIPIILFFIDHWLNQFAYRIEVSIWHILMVMAITPTIALLTITKSMLQSAYINPLDKLRQE